MLEFDHVTVEREEFCLRDITFSLEQGYLLGILGKNGAGKSTLLRTMWDRNFSYTGTIRYQGRDIRNEKCRFLENVAYLSDDIPFFEKKTALDNAKLYGNFYENMDLQLFCDYMEKMQVSKNMLVGAMSRGQRIRFQIALAGAREAKLYLMDEVTAGMDPVFRKEFYNILRELLAQEATIIMTTHVQSDVNRNMDYVCYLEQGELISFGENGMECTSI